MGIMQRWKGAVKADKLIGPGGSISDFIVKLPLTVTAVANTDYQINVPAGATLQSATVYTTTGYGAGTDAQISLGSAQGGAQYVTAVSIKAVGVVNLTLVGASAAALASLVPPVWVRVAQTGAPSATGAAILVLSFA